MRSPRTARALAAGLIAALVATFLVLLPSPAHADIVDVKLHLYQGQMNIAGTLFNLPQSGTVEGTVDDVTDELEANFNVPPISTTIEAFPGVFLPININLTNATTPGVTGTFDLDTGTADTTANLNVDIFIPALGATCQLGPLAVDLSTDPPGSALDPSNGQIGLSGAGFLIPAATCDNPFITPLINDTLGLPSTNSAADLVFVDDNCRGNISGTVTDSAANPLKNARVQLYPAYGSGELQRVYTDASGNYQFDNNLNCLDYRVQILKSGYTTQWYSDQPNWFVADDIHVNNAVATDADVTLLQVGELDNTLTVDVDDGANPVQGVWVRLYTANGYVTKIMTDANGRVRFTSLAPNTYFVKVVDDASLYAPEWFEDAPTYAGATGVVTTGAPADIDMSIDEIVPI